MTIHEYQVLDKLVVGGGGYHDSAFVKLVWMMKLFSIVGFQVLRLFELCVIYFYCEMILIYARRTFSETWKFRYLILLSKLFLLIAASCNVSCRLNNYLLSAFDSKKNLYLASGSDHFKEHVKCFFYLF